MTSFKSIYLLKQVEIFRNQPRFISKYIKSKLKDKKETHDSSFQSWAEFENRGFIKPEYMRSWVITEYGSPEEKLKLETVNTPEDKWKTRSDARRAYLEQAVRNPNDVLIKVHAASLNPIDIRMCEGYGAELFNFRRDFVTKALSMLPTNREIGKDSEFPLILGRDFSGTVVDVGTGVFDLQPGDDVYGTPSIFKNGSLSEYIKTDLDNVVQKPATLSHIQATTIPYVALTVVSALKEAFVQVKKKHLPKTALLLGGSGGVGTFTIQYLKARGYSVTVTCSTEGVALCNKLGAECIDYKTEDVNMAVLKLPKFGVIFDVVGAVSPIWAKEFLWEGGTFVTVKSPVIENTDKYGTIVGLTSSAATFAKTRFLDFGKYNLVWAFFKPDRLALLEVARMIDGGLIKPVLRPDNIYNFDSVLEGFKKLGEGHTKGKIAINVSGLPEVMHKPPVDKIIHL